MAPPPVPPGNGGPPPPPARGRTFLSWPVWLLTAATAVAWAPVVSVFLAYTLADQFGCQVNEASAQPCIVWGGIDLGGALYTMGVMGWLMLVTAPLILITAVAWLMLLARSLFRRFRGTTPT